MSTLGPDPTNVGGAIFELVGNFRNKAMSYRDFRDQDFGSVDEVRAFCEASGAVVELTDQYRIIKDMIVYPAGNTRVSLVDTLLMLKRKGVLTTTRNMLDVNSYMAAMFYDSKGKLRFPLVGVPTERGVFSPCYDPSLIFEAMSGELEVAGDFATILSLSRTFRSMVTGRGYASKRMVSFGVTLNNTYEKFYYGGTGRVVHAGSGPIGRLSQFCFPNAKSVVFVDPIVNVKIQEWLSCHSDYDVIVSDAAIYDRKTGLHHKTNEIVVDIVRLARPGTMFVLKISVEKDIDLPGLWNVKHWGRPHNAELIIESGGVHHVMELVRRKRNCAKIANAIRNNVDYYRGKVDLGFQVGNYNFGNYFDCVKPPLFGGVYTVGGSILPGARVSDFLESNENIVGDVDGRYADEIYRSLLSNGYDPGSALSAIAREANRRGMVDDDTLFFHLQRF